MAIIISLWGKQNRTTRPRHKSRTRHTITNTPQQTYTNTPKHKISAICKNTGESAALTPQNCQTTTSETKCLSFSVTKQLTCSRPQTRSQMAKHGPAPQYRHFIPINTRHTYIISGPCHASQRRPVPSRSATLSMNTTSMSVQPPRPNTTPAQCPHILNSRTAKHYSILNT